MKRVNSEGVPKKGNTKIGKHQVTEEMRSLEKIVYCRSQHTGNEKGRIFDDASNKQWSRSWQWRIRTCSWWYLVTNRCKKGADRTYRTSRQLKCGTKQQRKFPLLTGSEHVTLTSVYHIPGMNNNIISYSRLHEKGVTTAIRNGVWHLTVMRDGITFGRLSKRQSDGLFLTTIRSCQAQEQTCSSVGLDGNKVHPKIITALSSPTVSLCHHR